MCVEGYIDCGLVLCFVRILGSTRKHGEESGLTKFGGVSTLVMKLKTVVLIQTDKKLKYFYLNMSNMGKLRPKEVDCIINSK